MRAKRRCSTSACLAYPVSVAGVLPWFSSLRSWVTALSSPLVRRKLTDLLSARLTVFLLVLFMAYQHGVCCSHCQALQDMCELDHGCARSYPHGGMWRCWPPGSCA